MTKFYFCFSSKYQEEYEFLLILALESQVFPPLFFQAFFSNTVIIVFLPQLQCCSFLITTFSCFVTKVRHAFLCVCFLFICLFILACFLFKVNCLEELGVKGKNFLHCHVYPYHGHCPTYLHTHTHTHTHTHRKSEGCVCVNIHTFAFVLFCF